MQSERLRWGVLGTARIADAQVRAIRMSNNSELVAIASREHDTARAWAAQREVPNAFGSYDEMLASDLIDAVYIPLPNGMHKEWTVKAMQQGKHVLCEKPLASDAAEVREIITAADANGVKCMEAFMYRFHPLTGRLVQLLAEGKIGTPRVIRATFGFNLTNPRDIRLSAELAGGAIMDVGAYCVNMARLLAGGNPLTVTASAVWAANGVDETMAGTLHFPGDLLAVIDCSFKIGTNSQQSLSISGSEGLIIVTQPFARTDAPVQIVFDKAAGRNEPSQIETIEVPGAYQYHLMIESFADAVLNDHPVAYSLHDSLGNMQTIDALKEAARTGQTVQVGS